MLRCQPANGISRETVARQKKRLASAAAKVDLPPLAALARLLHPVGSTESLKYRRLKPDFRQAGTTNVGELQPADVAGGLARQHGPIRRYGHEHTAPPLQTCLGRILKIIGKNMDNLQPISQPSPGVGDNRCRPLHL